MSYNYLFIGAHPDDIEFGCGGVVAKLKAEGHNCIFVVATNGEQGSLTLSKEELAKTRKNEALQSAKIFGVTDVEFLDLPDGLIKFTFSHKIKLIEMIRKHKPKSVFIHSKYDHHPDHEIIHRLSMAAIKSAHGPWFKEASGEPHQVSAIYGYEVWNPINEYQLSVDITPYFDKKITALAEHKSQTANYPYEDAIKGLASYRGAMVNGSGLAEVFEVLRTSI